MRTPVTITMGTRLLSRLDEFCKREDKSRSEIIEEAVKEFIERIKNE